jgi:predicted lactoylglutathione lyase
MTATMTETATRSLFLNLSVKDLERSKAFFGALGFGFNAQFTDENAACMVVGKDCFVMLLQESYFRTFTKKAPCDTSTQSEGLYAVSCVSRAEVDEMADKALKVGGSVANAPADHGFMYVRSFYDLDGHHWELMWMDPNAIQQA